MELEELHPKRREVLEELARRAGGRATGTGTPTVRELAGTLGYASAQTVHHHLSRLEADGYIRRGKAPSRKRRPLELTELGWSVVGSAPVMGRVAAGRGLEAIEDAEMYSLTELLKARDGGRRYLLRSVGQSMTGAGIEDGDLLIVEEDEDPPEGSVVVALIDGGEEATVKRLRREGSLLRLQAHNGGHRDIVVSGERVRIQGRVEYVFHPPRG